MRLDQIIPQAARSQGGALGGSRTETTAATATTDATEITELAYDNRAVTPGALFFCVRGFTRDGHDFAQQATQSGAAALVVDHPLPIDVPQVVVPDVRAAMAPAAIAFFGDPTAELEIVGVTGTNGKTTTAHLVRQILLADGRSTGLLGTVLSVAGGVEQAVTRTTPEAIDLQRTFRAMLDGGDVACAMEASSHALALHRVDGIRFAAAVFTNLTQDHLDFHPTMEDYFAAKRSLFTDLRPRHAIVNLDDPYGRRLATELDGDGDRDRDGAGEGVIGFGIESPQAIFRATDVETTLQGARFTFHGPEGRQRQLISPLRGRFNVLNVLGALAVADRLGVPLDTAAAAIAGAAQVPGRFQTVEAGQPFAVVVDYAHTPDSLQNVLATARLLTEGRVHVVFGCGGDRDRAKRPLMGAIAEAGADRVIVTSDNPRSEDPEAIIAEILTGIEGAVEHTPDRRAAIRAAVATADEGDIVVVAGKGHEQGQEFAGGAKLPFDDVDEVQAALRERP